MAHGTIIICMMELGIGICFLLASLSALAQSKDEPTHVQVGRAVFRLETAEIIDKQGNIAKMRFGLAGTAFVVGADEGLYLVTARHVAELPHDLRARVPTRRNDTGKTDVVELRIPRESWILHPVGPEARTNDRSELPLRGVDVAVTRLSLPQDRSVLEFRHCTSRPPGHSNQIALVDPKPPQSIVVVGFPRALGFTLREQRPMFRSGIVALVAGERFLEIEGSFADERTFVIDSKIEPGNSGSPILRLDRVNQEISVVGLVSAASAGSDFGVAEPASRILETIERARANPPSRLPEWYLLQTK